MFVKLFDIQNGALIPTEHCFALKTLKNIMDKYPDDYLKVYQYLFYMTCPSADNAFFTMPEDEKEELILEEIEAEFSTEDDAIQKALAFCETLYSTPTSRAYKGISKMLDKLAKYMEVTAITHGRDGNINSLIAAAKNFDQIRASFKGAYKDLKEEQDHRARGGQQIAYDM